LALRRDCMRPVGSRRLLLHAEHDARSECHSDICRFCLILAIHNRENILMAWFIIDAGSIWLQLITKLYGDRRHCKIAICVIWFIIYLLAHLPTYYFYNQENFSIICIMILFMYFILLAVINVYFCLVKIVTWTSEMIAYKFAYYLSYMYLYSFICTLRRLAFFTFYFRRKSVEGALSWIFFQNETRSTCIVHQIK